MPRGFKSHLNYILFACVCVYMCVLCTLYVQAHKGQDIGEEVLIPLGKNKEKQESLGYSVQSSACL